jgi:prepilin-type N-terminal cleavage/methylation domain-containing protein
MPRLSPGPYWPWRRRPPLPVRASQQGFTLMELIVVVAIAGILGTIAAPSWVQFWDAQRARGAQDEAYLSIRQTQSNAIRTNRRWRIAFRNNLENGTGQWSTYPIESSESSAQPPASQLRWQTLANRVKIDQQETTLRTANGVWIVDFNQRGAVHGQLGRVTVIAGDRPTSRRCVIVSTLGGALREGHAVQAPADQRQCD